MAASKMEPAKVESSTAVDKSYRYYQFSTTMDQLNEFRHSDLYIDVTLKCNEHRIGAHKIVLAAASPYFLALFYGNFPESKQKEIELKEVHGDSLVAAVNFIYGEPIVLNNDTVVDVMETVLYLQLDALIDKCVDYVRHNLEIDNCLTFRQLSKRWGDFALLEAIDNYILTHFKEIVANDDFLEMGLKEITSILSQDQLYLQSDELILNGIVRWANHKPLERLRHLAELLRYIHPACISTQAVQYRPTLLYDDCTSKWYHRAVECGNHLKPHIFVMDKMGRQPCLQRFDETFETSVNLATLPRNLFAVSLTGYKNILYAQGGDIFRPSNKCYYFNVYRNQWFDMPDMLLERSHHRSLVVNDCLYAIGGKSNAKVGVTSSMESLNLHTNQVSYKENMTSKRTSCGASLVDGVIYVCGGETEHRPLHSAERYDPRDGIWQNLPNMSSVNSYTACAAIDQYVYCCEGLASYMERFDVRAHKWELINFWQEYEFYEIFALQNVLHSISGPNISRYELAHNRWSVVHTFEKPYDWGTVVTMEMVKEYIM